MLSQVRRVLPLFRSGFPVALSTEEKQGAVDIADFCKAPRRCFHSRGVIISRLTGAA